MNNEKKINPFVAFLKLIRFENLVIIVATQYLFEYFVFRGLLLYPDKVLTQYFTMNSRIPPLHFGMQLSHFDFFLLSLSTVMIAAAGYIINDYFDVKTDRINRPLRIVIDRGIKRRVAMAAHVLINILGIGIGMYVGHKAGNYQLGLIHVFTAGLLWFYSTNFKKMFFVGNIVVAFLAGLVPLLVAIFETHLLNFRSQNALALEPMYRDFISQVDLNLNIPLYFAAGFGLFAFLSNLMREIVKDMEDFVGDMETGGQTVPIKLGYTTTKNIVHAINVLTITLLIYVSWKLFNLYQDKISVIYLSLTTIVPLIIFSFILFKSDSTKKFKRAGMFLKFVMLFGILYSLIIWYNCSKA